ncbi:hypothetical protein ACTXT7_007744 [Hymenolepis weldensis]
MEDTNKVHLMKACGCIRARTESCIRCPPMPYAPHSALSRRSSKKERGRRAAANENLTKNTVCRNGSIGSGKESAE